MKISEIVEDLKKRPATAQLFVAVPETEYHPFRVESIAQQDQETAVMMVARPSPEDSIPMKWKRDITARKSEMDGKYELVEDGKVLFSGIETENDAELCAKIFVLGIRDGLSTQITFLCLHGDRELKYPEKEMS